jgi:hypothetical protein
MSLRRYTADEWCSIGNGIFWFIPFFNIIAESHVFFHSLSTVLLNDVGARVSALITSFAGIWLIRNNWLFISLFYVYLTHIDILFLVVHLNQMISRISFDWNWATFLIVLIIKVAEAIILVCKCQVWFICFTDKCISKNVSFFFLVFLDLLDDFIKIIDSLFFII